MTDNRMWAFLVHLGWNMWEEATRVTKLNWDREAWNKLVAELQTNGCNTVILDLGEGIRYESHPELSIEGSLSRKETVALISDLKEKGFDIVPKLNFSACHNGWLGEYSRMVSTQTYYRVCEDLIDEVCTLFKPKYLHIGMDEEDMVRKHYDYVVIRQNELWWHDLYHLVDRTERNNVRPWVWSDYVSDHKDEYLSKMPKSVLQSMWYYLNDFANNDPAIPEATRNWTERRVRAFNWLADAGFDQVPAASNWDNHDNMKALARYCEKTLPAEKNLGYMQTVWYPCTEPNLGVYLDAAKALGETKAETEA